MYSVDIVLDLKTRLGEGPVWDAEQERLYFVDSKGKRVYRCTAEGAEVRTWEVPDEIGSFGLLHDGQGALIALGDGVYTLRFDSGEVELFVRPEDEPRNRLNDGKVDPLGRFVVGSMNRLEGERTGALYAVSMDGHVETLDDGLICSNGPCWSPDKETFYFSDTWSGEIWKYGFDPGSGAVGKRETFAPVDGGEFNAADGSTVDSEGYLWNAQVYDGRIVRYSPDGAVDRVLEMPVKKVTSVMFGGPNLDVLFVTSMAHPPLPRFPGDGFAAGSLFAIRGLGITGLPERRLING